MSSTKIFFDRISTTKLFFFLSVKMNSEQIILEKLDLIINKVDESLRIISLLTKQASSSDEHKTRKPRKSLLNLSKFVNPEQRDKILHFIQLPNTVFEITRLPKHKQNAALQKMIDNEFGVKISYYTSSKLVDTMLNENVVDKDSVTKSSDSENADDEELLSE